MNFKKRIAMIGAALGAVAVLAGPAKAQDFDFAGKQLKIVIGFGVGGTYGKYAQMFADHLEKYIPGNPTIIVESRPGAGGMLATNYAAQAMPANGLNYFVPPDSSVVVQLMNPDKAKYDMRKFTSIGTANQTNVIVVVRTDSGITKWEDLKDKEIPMGSTGLGSTAFIIPNLTNGLLGTKMKIVSGYKGSNETGLAVEQGEVRGAAFNWLFWKSGFGRWFEGDTPFAKAVLQVGLSPDPELPDVPMLKDLVDPADKPIVNFIGALGLIGRGLAAPPGTPEGAVKVMRAAWNKMIADPAFTADAQKRNLRVIPASGEEVQKAINEAINDAKPELVARAGKLVYGK
ncbi:MAG: tripartite tricarboxylate transporter substrate-binding protein, partial [Rhodospirillales bacterium]